MEWLKLSVAPLKDLIAFLHRQTKTGNIYRKQLLMELRNNLNVFSNGFKNNVPYDTLIDLLSNDAYQEATRENFAFRKLRPGKIASHHIRDDRNKRYIGWTAEQVMEKIDEKITELKNIKKMNNGSLKQVKNNIPLMMSNLYFRMKLLADFVRSKK